MTVGGDFVFADTTSGGQEISTPLANNNYGNINYELLDQELEKILVRQEDPLEYLKRLVTINQGNVSIYTDFQSMKEEINGKSSISTGNESDVTYYLKNGGKNIQTGDIFDIKLRFFTEDNSPLSLVYKPNDSISSIGYSATGNKSTVIWIEVEALDTAGQKLSNLNWILTSQLLISNEVAVFKESERPVLFNLENWSSGNVISEPASGATTTSDGYIIMGGTGNVGGYNPEIKHPLVGWSGGAIISDAGTASMGIAGSSYVQETNVYEPTGHTGFVIPETSFQEVYTPFSKSLEEMTGMPDIYGRAGAHSVGIMFASTKPKKIISYSSIDIETGDKERLEPSTSVDTTPSAPSEGQSFTVPKVGPEILDYSFKELRINNILNINGEGQFSGGYTYIEYVYNKLYNVTVNYQDELGKNLSDPIILKGQLGQNYTSEQKEFPSYSFKSVIGNTSGNFTKDNQVITYIYTRNTEGTLTPNEYQLSGNRKVTGTYSGDIKRVKLEVNGNLLPANTTVAENGTFSYYVDVAITKETDQVYIIGYDKDGKQLDRKQVKIINNSSVTQGNVVPDDYYLSGDRKVTGKYFGDIKRIKLEVNGKTLSTSATVASDGTFSFYADKSITKETDTVYVIGCDKNGKELDRKQVRIIKDLPPVPTGTLTPKEFNLLNERRITGTYVGSVYQIRLEVNGTLLSAVSTVASDGTFSYYVGSTIKSVTDKVYVLGYDKNGNQLDKKQVVIIKPTVVTQGALTPNKYQVAVDRKITGKYTGDVKRVRLEVNGVLLSAVTDVLSDGTFSYYAGATIKVSTDKVYVIGFDKDGKQLDKKQVELIQPAAPTQGTLTPKNFIVGVDRRIGGEYTGDVKQVKLEVNGVLVSAVAMVAPDGTFSYYAGSEIKSVNDQVYMIGLDKDGKQLDRKKVNISEPTKGTLLPKEYSIKNDRRVTGTYTGDVKRIKLEINGVLLSPLATVSTDGTFSYYVGSEIKTTTDKVYVIGYDLDGKQLDKKIVTVFK